MIKEFIAKIVERKLKDIYVHRTNKFHKKSIFEKWHDNHVKRVNRRLRNRRKDKTFTFWWFLAKNLQEYFDSLNVISGIADFVTDKRIDVKKYEITDIVVLCKTVFIYTRRPGLIIGKCGSNIDEMRKRINYNLKGEKINDYEIFLIEDINSGMAVLDKCISFNVNNY